MWYHDSSFGNHEKKRDVYAFRGRNSLAHLENVLAFCHVVRGDQYPEVGGRSEHDNFNFFDKHLTFSPIRVLVSSSSEYYPTNTTLENTKSIGRCSGPQKTMRYDSPAKQQLE
jgi:hypothetical protein